MLPKGFEWIVILVVVLIIFGPKSLPKLGQSLGATVKSLREGMADDSDSSSPVSEESDEDREIRELEAKLAEAKAKKESKESGDSDSPISE